MGQVQPVSSLEQALEGWRMIRELSQEERLAGLQPTWPCQLEELGESPPLASVRTLFH
jgi:hypothetical protein